MSTMYIQILLFLKQFRINSLSYVWWWNSQICQFFCSIYGNIYGVYTFMTGKATVIISSQSCFFVTVHHLRGILLGQSVIYPMIQLYLCAFHQLSHNFAAFFIQNTSSEEVSSSSLASQIYSLVFFGGEMPKQSSVEEKQLCDIHPVGVEAGRRCY